MSIHTNNQYFGCGDYGSQVHYPVDGFSNDQAYPVLRIIDDDTVEIDYDGQAVSVQLIGIDTPETVHPSQPVEAYGQDHSLLITYC